VNALAQYPVQASGPRLDNRRIAAGVVDLAVVAVFGLVLRAAAGGEFTAAIAAVTVAWGLFYYFVAESHWQQTLGKRLLGLRVQAQGGGVPDDRAIALRTVLRVVDGIAFYLVGLLVMLRTGERRQRLGDIVGETEIVDAREPVKPAVKSTINARVVGAPEAEAEDESVAAFEPVAELPDEEEPQAGEPVAEEPVAEEPVAEEDDEPRIEIVTEPAEDEPELPAAAELPGPELPRAEEREPEPEPQLPTSMDDEPDRARGPEVEEPVAEEPVAEEAEEPEAESGLPRVSSPAIEELAGDVASSASKPGSRPAQPKEEAPADEEITVKPVETVSPMDLVMGDNEPEQEQAGERSRAGSRDN
jgi:uncharacterized RDD family membrane protein YckC